MSVDLSMPILVVDDDNSVFRIFNNILQKMGIKDVDNAACGTEAPVKLRKKVMGWLHQTGIWLPRIKLYYQAI